MKISKVSSLFCALALTFSLVSFTTDKKEVTEDKDAAKVVKFDAALYKITQTNKVRLSVNKPAGENLRVSLRDRAGKVYYSELYNVSDSKYRRVFDLEGMGDGTYYFEMTNKKNKLVKEVEIHSTSEKLISLK